MAAPDLFARADGSADGAFYAFPRKVVHIEAGAIAALRALYARELPPGEPVLDLMSSWRSHLPEAGVGPVSALGMNAAEMADNPQITAGFVVHDLNADPTLAYADGAFGGVICAVSVQYLARPLEVFAEVRRVLRPGGRLVLAGEPTRTGDRLAEQWKRAGRVSVKLAAVVAGTDRVLRSPEPMATPGDAAASALESEVDLHLFRPAELGARVRRAGLVDVVTVTEELTANWFGWWTRTVEAMVRPGVLPQRYPWFAYRTWQRLSAFDEHVARRVVPPGAFYNCVLSARVPGSASA